MILRAAQLILSLFALFGGFFTKISPPPEGLSSGLASFVVLGLFLIIVASKAKTLTARIRQRWIKLASWSLGLGALLGIGYLVAHQHLVFSVQPCGTQISGLWLSEAASKFSVENSTDGAAALLAAYGGCGNESKIWPFWSHYSAVAAMYFVYIAATVLLLAAIFFITEGVFRNFQTDDQRAIGNTPASKSE